MKVIILLLFLSGAAIWDCRSSHIPNYYLLIMGVSGVFLCWMCQENIIAGLVGVGICFGVMLPLWFMRCFGAADIKLCGMLGLYLGYKGLVVIGISFFLAAGYGLLLLLKKGQLWWRIREGISYFITMGTAKKIVKYSHGTDSQDGITLPFALFLCMGMVVVTVF